MPDPIVGCAVAGTVSSAELRRCLLELRQQASAPEIHVIAIVMQAAGHGFLNDLLQPNVVIQSAPEPAASSAQFLAAMGLLYGRGVELFLCIDPAHIYRRDYVASIVQYLAAANIDAKHDKICTNLVEQEWTTSHGERFERTRPFHFRGGLGLAENEQQNGQRVGAPGTFALTRPAAALLLQEAPQASNFGSAPYDAVFRQTLLRSGVNIDLIATPAPVFVHVSRQRPQVSYKHENLARATSDPVNGNRVPDVSIVIPTYNEGQWLRKTVESITTAAGNLTWEAIIVEDGCSDGSVDAVRGADSVRIVSTPAAQSGLIVAKNLGASVARGHYLCFIDSHMLVVDGWLDHLRETCNQGSDEKLVSCNLFGVDQHGASGANLMHQYGYTLRDWTLGVRWHHFGAGVWDAPYEVPLCPGGMMFLRKSRFESLGGFASSLRKWGGEDVEFSLRHFCGGGITVVDPRTHCFHFFKDTKAHKPSFTITYKQTSFNAMYTARTYMADDDYRRVRAALAAKANLDDVVEDVESNAYDEEIVRRRSLFGRSFDDWMIRFRRELTPLWSERQPATAAQA
jgi:glycosyltransferase involved in cell wall biosynthesis